MDLQLIVAGLVGELLIRVYHEAGGVPQFHVEEVARGDVPNNTHSEDETHAER